MTGAAHVEQLHTALDTKARATLIARAALVELALLITDDDRGQVLFVASHQRWGLTRQMSTVAEVDDLIQRMGGR